MTEQEVTILFELLRAFTAQPTEPGSTQAYEPPSSHFTKPASIAEMGEMVIGCYHPTGEYRTVDVLEVPWSRGANYNADSSVLIRVGWNGQITKNPYQTIVGLVERGGQIRASVQGDNAVVAYNRNCQLEDWTTVRYTQAAVQADYMSGKQDLNQSREEIEALVKAAKAVLEDGFPFAKEEESIERERLIELMRKTAAVEKALKSSEQQ